MILKNFHKTTNGFSLNLGIVGAQKCGTTALSHLLSSHAEVNFSKAKEPHFFDTHYGKGTDWYQEQFPNTSGKINTEASPSYLFHPHALLRIHHHFPDCKIICLLRNPVDRILSHYWHEVKLGFEYLPFHEAILQEDARVEHEYSEMIKNESYDSFNANHFSYLKRSCYGWQVERLFSIFPRKQVLILKSEDLFSGSAASVSKLEEFVGIGELPFENFSVKNEHQLYPKLKNIERKWLQGLLKDSQALLNSVTCECFNWW